MAELIRLENLWKIYPLGPGVTALQDISLQVEQGQYIAIMGPSGSGKSTMLNLLGCLDRPTRGQYWLCGQNVAGMSENELSDVRSRRIGFVFQSFNLIASSSIMENIEVPMFYRGIPRRRRHVRCRKLAEMVGLGDRLHHRPAELSGGQQQRVAIARALANEPTMIVADEPTGNLDSQTAAEILDLMDDLHRRGRSIVMVTHEADIGRRADRVVMLRDGRIASDTFNGDTHRGNP